jgi:hypothetical protein
MVERRTNLGVCRLRGNYLFWLNSHGVEWFCKKCGKAQERNTYSIEMALSFKGQCVKMHICHPCAEQIFDESMARFTLLKNHGPDGYRLMTEVDGDGGRIR